jgi:serine/threonine-protein kinase
VSRTSDGDAQFSASSNGSLIYIPGPANTTTFRQLDLAWSDRKGTVEPLKLAARAYQFPRLSPDGRRVAFGIEDGKDADVWVYDLSSTSPPRRLTFGGRNRFPVWSADGQRVAFQSDRDGDAAIFWQRADISGRAERLTTPEEGTSHVPESWSPTTDVLLFDVMKESSVSLWTLSLREKKTAPFGGVHSSSPTGAVFSPDGRWVAYSAGEPRPRNHYIYVQPYPATGEVNQISNDADDGHHPMWSRDGKELFWVGIARFIAVSVTTQPRFSFGSPTLVPRGFTEGNAAANERSYDVAPDGKRFIGVVRASGQSTTLSVPQIHVVLNWSEEVKQRVPSK